MLVEIGETTRAGRTAQRTVEIVDPAVKGADQGVAAGSLFIRNQPAAAVTADIVESAYLAVLTAQDQRVLAKRIERNIIARFRQVRNVAGNLPVIAEHAFQFQFQEGFTVIGPAGQAATVPVFGN